jgi:hypothetical protein
MGDGYLNMMVVFALMMIDGRWCCFLDGNHHTEVESSTKAVWRDVLGVDFSCLLRTSLLRHLLLIDFGPRCHV